MAGAEYDRSDKCERKLSGKVGESFAAVFDEAGDAPDVVPKFAMWVGS